MGWEQAAVGMLCVLLLGRQPWLGPEVELREDGLEQSPGAQFIIRYATSSSSWRTPSCERGPGFRPLQQPKSFFIKTLYAPGYQGAKLICLGECVCLEHTIRYFVSFKIILRAGL